MFRWILKEVWEKINLAAVYRSIKALGRKHGKRFFWAAILWECVEDIVFPFFCWMFGVPGLIPVFLVLHFEPIVYPVFFWGFKMWDRCQGREPWDPDRPVHSEYWRSVVKVIVFQLAVTGWLSHFIPWKPLLAFSLLTSLFGFVHERIWHDTNYGIAGNDMVQFRRPFAKTGTYLLLSVFTLPPLLHASGVSPLWQPSLLAQSIIGLFYLILETIWAKSRWGVNDNHQEVRDYHE